MIRIPQVFLATLLAVSTTVAAIAQETIPWITDLSQARRIAEQNQRLVLLHFWGDGCPPCQQLESNVFNQPELIRTLTANFVPVKIHVQQQPNIANHYKITQIPTDIIVLPSGVQVMKTTSPANANAYLAMLDEVRANALTDGFQATGRQTQEFAGQAPPSVPSLPPRNQDEVPTSQALNREWTANDAPIAGSPPSWRSAPADPARSPDPVRGTIQTNEFVGPLDHQAAPSRTTTGPRYENPYLADALPPQPAPQTAAPSLTAPPAASRGTGFSPTETPPTHPLPGNAVGNRSVDRRENEFAPAGTPAPNEPPAGNRFVPVAPANPNWTAPESPPNFGVAPVQPQDVLQPQVAPNSHPAPNGPVQNPNLPQLPPGVPPLALDGFCPVTLMNLGKWERGDARFGAVHRDRTYLFKSQIERDRFLAPASADRFAPVLSGLDPVRFAELGQIVDGRREHGVLFDGQIYLFADEEALLRFEQQPQRYVAAVRQAMANNRLGPAQR